MTIFNVSLNSLAGILMLVSWSFLAVAAFGIAINLVKHLNGENND